MTDAPKPSRDLLKLVKAWIPALIAFLVSIGWLSPEVATVNTKTVNRTNWSEHEIKDLQKRVEFLEAETKALAEFRKFSEPR
jgi:hypothetical protein